MFTNKIKFGLLVVGSVFIGIFLFYQNSQSNNQKIFRYKLPLLVEETKNAASISEIYHRLKQDPTNSAYKLELAEAYFEMFKSSGQNEYYQKALDLLDRRDQGAKLLMAKMMESQHHFFEAVELSKEVLAQKSDSRAALNILITSNMALGNLNLAIEYADQLVKIFPRTSTLSLRGIVLLSLGREAEGVFDLERSIAIEDVGERSDSAWARSILARHFITCNRLDDAEFLLKEALRISPVSHLAMDLTAQLHAARGDILEAENLFEKAFRESRQLANLRHYAELNFQTNKNELAFDRWAQVEQLIKTEIATGRLDHRIELVKVLVLRKKNQDLSNALVLLKDEIEVRKNADTIFLLALTYKELNQWAQARDSVESLLRTGASQSRYYLLASTVFLNLGNISKAKLYNDLAIGLDPLAKERLIFL